MQCKGKAVFRTITPPTLWHTSYNIPCGKLSAQKMLIILFWSNFRGTSQDQLLSGSWVVNLFRSKIVIQESFRVISRSRCFHNIFHSVRGPVWFTAVVKPNFLRRKTNFTLVVWGNFWLGRRSSKYPAGFSTGSASWCCSFFRTNTVTSFQPAACEPNLKRTFDLNQTLKLTVTNEKAPANSTNLLMFSRDFEQHFQRHKHKTAPYLQNFPKCSILACVWIKTLHVDSSLKSYPQSSWPSWCWSPTLNQSHP